MVKEELIKTITEEVMRKLKTTLNNSKDYINFKKRAVILGETKNFNRDIYKDNGLIEYYKVDEVRNIDIDACDLLFIEELKIIELANISLGLYERDKEKIIIEALLKGKKVGVLYEGLEFKKYKNTANKNLYNLYSSYEEKIYNFGINITELNDIDTFFEESFEKKHIKEKGLYINEESNKEPEISKGLLDLSSKRVVCESDLKKTTIRGYKSIKVNKNTIITPLAKELIKQNKLNILRE